MSELKNSIHHNLMSLIKYIQRLLKSSTHFCLINVTRTTPRAPPNSNAPLIDASSQFKLKCRSFE